MVCLIWGGSLFFGMFTHFPIIRIIGKPVPYIILAVCIFNGIRFIREQLKYYDYVFFLTWLFLFLASYLFPFNYSALNDHIYSFSCEVLPAYFIGRFLYISRIRYALIFVSCLSIFLKSWYYLVYTKDIDYSGSTEVLWDNMAASYQIMPHVIFMFWMAFDEKIKIRKIFYSFIAALGLFLNFSFGTRGVIVCIATFIVIYTLFFQHYKYPRFAKISIILLFALFIAFLEFFFLILDEILLSIGVSNRITEMYLMGSFASGDSVDARGDLQSECWELLMNGFHPFGFGICGSWHYIGTYPHNILCDVFFSLGFILGGVFLIWLLLLLFRAIIYSIDRQQRIFVLLLLCCSILKLMFSGTYINESFLFLFIGYCVKIIKQRKYNDG